MVYSEFCRDKLSQYKIEGQSKPFIDQNLQLQLPGYDFYSEDTHHSYNPIYSHYIGSTSSSYLASEVNEAELYRVMEEAELSYKSWKQMHQQLNQAINYQSSSIVN